MAGCWDHTVQLMLMVVLLLAAGYVELSADHNCRHFVLVHWVPVDVPDWLRMSYWKLVTFTVMLEACTVYELRFVVLLRSVDDLQTWKIIKYW